MAIAVLAKHLTSILILTIPSVTAAFAPNPATNGSLEQGAKQATQSSAVANAYIRPALVAPPTVTAVDPSSGPPPGGGVVTITGTGFTGVTSVTFQGTPVLSFTVVSPTSITATVPPGSPGSASVIVTADGGSNDPNTLYAYVVATPTLGEWGMVLLSALLILYAWLHLRRRDDAAGLA